MIIIASHRIAMWIKEVKNVKNVKNVGLDLTILSAQWIFTQWRKQDVAGATL